MEAIAERPDGTRVPFIPYPTPLFDTAGRLTGVINVLVDIGDHKRAETCLAERNAQLDLAGCLSGSGHFLLVGMKSARRTTNVAVDPSHKFGLRHDRLLTAVADHVAGCNAGLPAATSAEPQCAVCSVQGG